MEKKSTELSPKQAMFCELYARVESETYSEKKASAIAAGYAEGSASEMARRLTNDNLMSMARIEKIYEENAREHKGRILSNLEFQRRGAIKAEKWDAANTSCKLQAQIFGFLLADSVSGVEDSEQKKLTEAEAKEARRIATLLNLADARKENIADSEEARSAQSRTL